MRRTTKRISLLFLCIILSARIVAAGGNDFGPSENNSDDLNPNPDNYDNAKSVSYFNTFDNFNQ